MIIPHMKELIKVKGYQVAPAELEGHLLDHPHIADSGVIGLPDEYSGELPLAFVVLQPHIASKVQIDESAAAEVRSSIFKVSNSQRCKSGDCSSPCSMSPKPSLNTNG